MKLFRNLLANNEGATAIEYGLIAALVAVAAIAAMGSLGDSLGNTFNKVSGDMTNASDGDL
ncbi:Flp family type IVb pilin [Novosphingobium sp. ERN07]|jgi:pilus assembly protein Flp/PilA|uniref:Flp family type IVb pilin n=1 Tax=Novosphingobium sp. ERN07 TaxID=2726187 RepID=UPI001456739D|nr:Flp family type IVb pilin [Novosphingobium sp. ERN07]NLR69969.1 Flp family type IVb pilin [Novosphingobium sp. ERN07]